MTKICVLCGREFRRRLNETNYAFGKRQKCMANCLSKHTYSLTVLGSHEIKRLESIKPGAFVETETVFFSKTWISANHHWLKFYD